MIHDPQQELFTRIKLDIEALGYDVYDGFLPPEGTSYPFVYLGDAMQIDDPNKSVVFGNVHQTIHVWSNTPTGLTYTEAFSTRTGNGKPIFTNRLRAHRGSV